jgi:hypothetical protein
MSARISDCPPLLEPGEHVRTVAKLRELCVANFPLSSTRAAIMDGFVEIVRLLEEERIPCQLVVDGSFLTEEINPEDIDFVVVVTPDFYEEFASESQLKLLDWIRDSKDIKATHLSDCYLCVEYKAGDRYGQWFDGICDKAWWANFYSQSKVYKQIRGVAIVEIQPKGIAT